jgi:hypothetical protein
MAERVVQVYLKARAIVDALARMPCGIATITPRGHFIRDYNDLRQLALEAQPGLDERLLGKSIPVRQTAPGEGGGEASFIEIEAYARQILEQFARLLPSEPMPRPAVEAMRAGRGDHGPDQAGKPWSRAEDAELAAACDAGESIRDLAASHRRTEGAIRSRLLRLGKLTVGSNATDGPDPSFHGTPDDALF